MANKRTLVAYYSLSGTTAALAKKLAAALDADLEEISTQRELQPGWATYWTVGLATLSRQPWRLKPPAHTVTGYDLVVVGGPVWMGNIAGPVRAWMTANSLSPATDLGAFVTLGGQGGEAALRDMAYLAGRSAKATLAVTESDRKSGREAALVADFVRKLMPLRLAA